MTTVMRLGQTADDSAVVACDGTSLQFVIIPKGPNAPFAEGKDLTTRKVFERFQRALNRFHAAWGTGRSALTIDGKLGTNTHAATRAMLRFAAQSSALSVPKFPPGFPDNPEDVHQLAKYASCAVPTIEAMAALAPKEGGDKVARKGRKSPWPKRLLIAGGLAAVALTTGVLAGKQHEQDLSGG